MKSLTRSHWGMLLLLFGLAFALRVYDLEGQSMWSDEGLSLYRIRQPVGVILANTITVDGLVSQDTTPPFYFLLGHLWRAVSGESVFALRFWGAMVGVLAVPLAYLLGRLLYGRFAGLLTALFLTISPFHVWQSQVLRNYGLLLTLNLLAVYALYRAVLRPGRWGQGRWLLLWLLASLLGVYTHFFGLFVLAYGVLVLAITAVFRYNLGRWLRQKWVWLAGSAAIGLLLPLLQIGWQRFRAGPQVDFGMVSVNGVVQNGLSAFSIGMSPVLVHPVSWVAPVVALAVVGLLIGWRQSPQKAWLLLGYQIVPLGLLLLLSTINPLYNGTRHLLIGLPPFLLFLSVGMAGLSLEGSRAWLKRGSTVVRLGNGLLLAWGVGVVLGQLGWLHAQFTRPELRRDDVRGAAEYIAAAAGPGDVVILHDTLIRFVFDYYYDGVAPVMALPTYGMYDPDAALAALETAGLGAERVWFLSDPKPRNGFPRDLLDEWIGQHWQRLGTRTFPHMWLPVGLKVFAANPVVAAVPETAVSFPNANWDNVLHLRGVVGLDVPLQSGSPWAPQFYWGHDGAARDYQLTLRFTDEAGTLWGEVGWPLWPFSKPTLWPTGALIRDQQQLDLPAGLPPGNYQLWLRLIDVVTQEPVLLPDGSLDLLLQTAVAVAPNPHALLADLPPHTTQFARWRDVAMVGYELDQQAVYRPGHKAPISVYWQVVRPLPAAVQWVVQFVDEAGQVVGEEVAAPTRADYPATMWQAGELLRGQMRAEVPARATQDSYLVRLGLRDGAGRWLPVNRWGAWVVLGRVVVEPWPLVTELPPLLQPVGALFGSPPFAQLAGFAGGETAVAAGDTVPLTLYWQAVGETAVNLRIFLHLQNEQGEIVAQGDDFPVNGVRPTSSWRLDEVLIDDHALVLPADLPPGRYPLWVGLYAPKTGERPLVRQGEEVSLDGRLLLTTLDIP